MATKCQKMIVFLWYRSEISSYMIKRKFVAPTTKFRFQFGEEILQSPLLCQLPQTSNNQQEKRTKTINFDIMQINQLP